MKTNDFGKFLSNLLNKQNEAVSKLEEKANAIIAGKDEDDN